MGDFQTDHFKQYKRMTGKKGDNHILKHLCLFPSRKLLHLRQAGPNELKLLGRNTCISKWHSQMKCLLPPNHTKMGMLSKRFSVLIQLCTHTHHSASQRWCSIRCGTKLKVSKSSKGKSQKGLWKCVCFFFFPPLKHVFWGFFFTNTDLTNLPTGISVWPLQDSSHSVSTRCFSVSLWQPLESPGVVSCWKATFKYPVYNIWMDIEIAASWVVSYDLKKAC